MKTGIEILGNIKKLALAAVVLMCANVEGWGQAEHVDYTVKLTLEEISHYASYTTCAYYICVGFKTETYNGQTKWINKSQMIGSHSYICQSFSCQCSFELQTAASENIKSIRTVRFAIKVGNGSECNCPSPSNDEIDHSTYTRIYTFDIQSQPYTCTRNIIIGDDDYIGGGTTPRHLSTNTLSGGSPMKTTFSLMIIPQKPSIIKFVGANNISKPASDMGNYMVNDRGTGLQASYIDVYGGNMQYNWEFKCGNTIKQISTVGSSVGFTGNAVFGVDEFLKMVENKTPIYVKTKLCDLSSDEIILHPKLSSPTVASIEQTPPSCNGASDGKAVIRFSRAVYNKELLQFAVKGISGIAHTVPPGSDTYTLTGLSAGIDTIIINGRYPENNN